MSDQFYAIYPSIHPSTHPSIHPSTHPSIHPYACLPAACLPIYPPTQKIQVSLKSDKNNRYFTVRPMYIYEYISLNLRRMRNVSDRSCRQSQNTHFMSQ